MGGQWTGANLTPRTSQERFNATGMRSDGGGGVGAIEAHVKPESGTAGIRF